MQKDYDAVLEEIENARLKPGEDSTLEERFRLLANTEKILEETADAEDRHRGSRKDAEGGESIR